MKYLSFSMNDCITDTPPNQARNLVCRELDRKCSRMLNRKIRNKLPGASFYGPMTFNFVTCSLRQSISFIVRQGISKTKFDIIGI
jgi:hypothetical protein